MLSNCCNIKVQVYANIGPNGTAFYEYIDKRWMDQMSGLTTPWAIKLIRSIMHIIWFLGIVGSF